MAIAMEPLNTKVLKQVARQSLSVMIPPLCPQRYHLPAACHQVGAGIAIRNMPDNTDLGKSFYLFVIILRDGKQQFIIFSPIKRCSSRVNL